MAGQLYSGTTHKNASVKHAKAYCEGMAHRATGTGLQAPVTDNPHVAASDAGVAWIAGWTFADDAEGGAIDSSATCCSVSGTIAA